jgi:arsenite-transporting ATPase
MTPRTILYTGKGGVGKTSVAAGTARRCAARGLRTLAISTDPAHSLGDSLGVSLGEAPTPAGESLWAQQVMSQHEMERHWSSVQGWAAGLLSDRGIDRIAAEELSVLPGMDEVFSLLALRDAHQSADWDVIVVDCAPTGETLRMLSFPEVAGWWLERFFPAERQLLAAARPLARTLLDLELPGQAVFDELRRLSENLIALGAILRDRSSCSVRLVMNPDRMVVGEAMRTFTYLNLYGYLTDAVVVNRLFPPGVGDYFASWQDVQEEQLELVRSAFSPVPILCAPYFEQEVMGSEMLDRLAAALFDALDPSAILFEGITQELDVQESSATLRLALPLASKGELSLKRVGADLIVKVGDQRRTIALPDALRQLQPSAAKFEQGTLEIIFPLPRPVVSA